MTMPDAKDGAEPAGAWAQSAKLSFRFLFLAVCLAAVGWSVSNFRQVPPESRAIVYRFGSIVRQQGAGLLVAWPRPVEQIVILPSEDRQIEFRVEQFEPDSATGGDFMISDYARENTAFLLTGDASVVHLQATLLYQIIDPAAYILSAEHVRPALQRLFVASAVAVCASRDIDTILTQDGDNPIVRQDVTMFIADQFPDAVANRFRGMGFAAVHRLDRSGEKIFQFEQAARRGHVLVRGHPAHRGFMHRNCVGNEAKIERTQMTHAVG